MSQSRQTTLAGANDAAPSAVLTDRESGGTVELPVLEGTMGPPVIDIRSLYAGTGKFSYDPGYTATGSCKSKITYIDGEQGVLLHRGYPIDELAEQSDFLEVSYLLLHGELPNAAERDRFVNTITKHTMVHEQINYLYRGFRRDSHPMAVMIGVVGALAAFYHDTTDIDDAKQRMIASHRLIAKMPTFAAMAYKYSIGQPFVYPRNDLTYAENFLHMMFAVPCEDYQINPIHARAMDRLLILHADHEQNASTSTVRLAGSSGANPYACIAAGIATLWGPAHGGANEAVLQMLEEIGTVESISTFIGGPRTRTTPSGSWASATGSTRTTTHARRSCGKPATRCSTISVSATSCSRSRWSWSGSRLRTSILWSASFTPMSISTRALSCRLSVSRRTSSR